MPGPSGPQLPQGQGLHRLEFELLAQLAALGEETLGAAEIGVLCQVSGGRDSMALVQALHAASRHPRLRGVRVHLSVHHCNHHRRQEALRDEEFVRAWCSAQVIPFILSERSAWGQGNFQEEARTWRREEGRRHLGLWLPRGVPGVLATAHHGGDQVETVLMHLVRGSGTAGLRGIPVWSRGYLWRPWAMTRESRVEAYARDTGLQFCTDLSNGDVSYARNRIRLHVVPELARINPSYDEAILRLAANVREETLPRGGFLGAAAPLALGVHTTPADIKAYAACVDEDLARGLSRACTENLLHQGRLSRALSRVIPLRGGWTCVAEAGQLRFESAKPRLDTQWT